MTGSLILWINRVAGWIAASSWGGSDYLKPALLFGALVVASLAAYRVWQEIHDVEDPDTPADLLSSFEEAHAAGALDPQELDRVRRRLGEVSAPGSDPDPPAQTGSRPEETAEGLSDAEPMQRSGLGTEDQGPANA